MENISQINELLIKFVGNSDLLITIWFVNLLGVTCKQNEKSQYKKKKIQLTSSKSFKEFINNDH